MTQEKQAYALDERMTDLYKRNIAQLGAQDIVVATLGGSGQTLVGNMLRELGLNYCDIYTEKLKPDGSCQQVAEHADFRRRLAATEHRDSSAVRIARKPWPRFVKTHYPREAFSSRPLRGVWIVIRDPRDALFSIHRYRTDFGDESWDRITVPFGEWLTHHDTTGHYPLDDWTDFYLGWLDQSQPPELLTVTKFEELKTNPGEALRDALRSFDIPVTETELQQAIDRSSFDAMRAHEDAILARQPDGRPQARLMRRGVVGEWREWMTPELQSSFGSEALIAAAARFGYHISAPPVGE